MLLQKDLFGGGGGFRVIFPIFRAFPVQGKFLGRPKVGGHVPKMPPPPRSIYVKVIILLIFLTEQYQFLRTLPYVTVIKEPINTTSDGTFLSVVCENTKKVLLAKSWGGGGGCGPPSPPPPRNYPPVVT